VISSEYTSNEYEYNVSRQNLKTVQEYLHNAHRQNLKSVYHNNKNLAIHSFIHSIAMCRMRPFPAVLSSFFHSPLLHTFSCHPSPPTIFLSSLTSSCCYLFLGLPLNLVFPKFVYNTLLWILFPSILCTCPNKHNLVNLTVSIIVGFFNTCINFFIS